MKKITLQEYYDMLQAHDWWYQYSDDYSVYKRGLLSLRTLELYHVHGEKFQKLYNDYYTYVFDKVYNPEANTVKPPRPE